MATIPLRPFFHRLLVLHRTIHPATSLARHPTIRHSSFRVSPAPPRLPKEEQEIFERLQKQSTGAFSTPLDVRDRINQSPQSSSSSQAATPTTTLQAKDGAAVAGRDGEVGTVDAKVDDGEELHPNVRRGARPEFEGDVNPKTGEVGGPKNEPLRWGGEGDWSYNGRVTDF